MSQPDNPSTDGHPIGGAIYDVLNWYNEANLLPEHRRYLARGVQGPVLDVGTGTGGMLPYFGAVAQRDGPIQLHGIEPDPHLRARAEQKAERVGFDIDIRSAEAESLPYANESFTVVVASMVFCTISDVEQALEEINRVLRADGELRFFEHVRSDDSHGRYQDLFTPVWKRIAGGCHLNRRTGRTLANSPLEITEIDRFDTGMKYSPTKKCIRGTATTMN
jgi:ubiquinone/menaquinone biosynthesis C-methylase UbiE